MGQKTYLQIQALYLLCDQRIWLLFMSYAHLWNQLHLIGFDRNDDNNIFTDTVEVVCNLWYSKILYGKEVKVEKLMW